MHLRQLEIFRAVMASGTTTGAALSLCISEPAVSRTIANAEGALDLQLFERDRGRLIPTEEAERLLDGQPFVRLSPASPLGYLVSSAFDTAGIEIRPVIQTRYRNIACAGAKRRRDRHGGRVRRCLRQFPTPRRTAVHPDDPLDGLCSGRATAPHVAAN